MSERDKKGDAKLTSAKTDTETGTEGLSAEEEKTRHINTLKTMHAQGLITDEEYEKQISDA